MKFVGKEFEKYNKSKKTKSKPKLSKPNLGWLFYKDYFNSIEDNEYIEMLKETRDKNIIENIEEKIKEKVENILVKKLYSNYRLPFPYQKFTLTTIYPGLIVGSGYIHELKDIESQIILGFDFDYTTGEPIIRGSSIKGVLKHAFEHKDYIEELLGRNIKNFEEFKDSIFENGDVFLDAVVIKCENNLLEDDYITPHREITKNPIPLRLIKIAPDVTFEFRFLLNDFEDMKKEEKLELFKKIILDLGLGAKTNVGFGKFKETKWH